MDPANPQSFNRYSYVSNNPLRFTDPSGLDFCDWIWDCFGLVKEGGGKNKSTGQRPRNTQFITASSMGNPTFVDGLYTIPQYNYGATLNIPVGTTFTYGGTVSQFIASASASGFYLSSGDQYLSDSGLSSHKGIAMRSNSTFCNIHVNISRVLGRDGYPRIDTHYDLISPFTQNPSPTVVATLPLHALIDFIPDIVDTAAGLPGTIGDRVCGPSIMGFFR